MSISPGNLYYHFGNKDQIVCAVFERLGDALNTAWERASRDRHSLSALEHTIQETLQTLVEYRFVPRELFAMSVHSPVLRERSHGLMEKQTAVYRDVVAELVNTGVLADPGGHPAMASLADAMVLALFGYVPLAELQANPLDSTTLVNGSRFVMSLLTPHLERTPGLYRTEEALNVV